MSIIYNVFDRFNWNQYGNFPLHNFFLKHSVDLYNHMYIEPMRMLHRFGHKGMNFMERDWDNVIVLDAMRADVFERHNFIEGDYHREISTASNTVDWVIQCLTRRYNDIVLVTANPKHSKNKLEEYTGDYDYFYHNEPVWDYGWDAALNEGGLPTVHPYIMVDIIRRKIQKRYPGKRKIIWFLQPHYPFFTSPHFPDGLKPFLSIKQMEQAWRGYNENTKMVLQYVEELIELLEGKTVITSDHGENFGEMFIFEHPEKMYIPTLTEVPYLEVEK